jgi:2,3-bisphosphoglycerate-independent phosphoglycerate mutase
VTDIWLWGQGRPKALPPLAERFGVRGAVITAVDIIRGLAVQMGLELIDVPGATGWLDTDYAAKGRAAVAALDRYDLVVVHVEAPDEAAHQGSAEDKVRALEQTDALIVGPVLEKLRSFEVESRGRGSSPRGAGNGWRILIAPDHVTSTATTQHGAAPPPYCMAGDGIPADAVADLETRVFCEAAGAGQPAGEPGNPGIAALFADSRPG